VSGADWQSLHSSWPRKGVEGCVCVYLLYIFCHLLQQSTIDHCRSRCKGRGGLSLIHSSLATANERDRHCLLVLLLVSCGGVRLSLLGTSVIVWPIVPAPDDR
jgi:hypothetical protein